MAGGDERTTPAATSSSSSSRRKARLARGSVRGGSLECQEEGTCSSCLTASSNESSLRMVTPVQPPKSLDTSLEKVTPIQPSKCLDYRSSSCGSGSLGSDSEAAPFYICLGDSKSPIKLKSSLLEINREKRRERELAKGVGASQYLRPGMLLLKKFLKPEDQVEIIGRCQKLGVGAGGFYAPGYRDGAKLCLRMMCLGKNWDPDSSSYGDIRPSDGARPPDIPEKFGKLVTDAIQASHEFLKQKRATANPLVELPPISPNICIVNFYTSTGRLGLHQDKDETQASLSKGLPVVSFSLGDTAEFLYGDVRDADKSSKVDLESGDVLIFGGPSRRIFHGVSKIKPKTAPLWLTDKTSLRPGRLNLTFRQY